MSSGEELRARTGVASRYVYMAWVSSAAVPSVEDLIVPILRGIGDGREYTMDDLVKVVAKSMSLSEGDLGRLAPSGKTTQVRYRISWAKSRLKKAEFAYYPSRGLIAITVKGLEALKSNPSRINWRPINTKTGRGADGGNTPNGMPTFEDMMLPLLAGIRDGGKYSMDDLVGIVAKSMNLPEDVITELTPNRQMTKVRHRLGWAKSYLKNAGLLKYPSRGLAQISEKGEDVVNSNPPRIDRAYLDEMPADDSDMTETDNNNDLTPEETIMHEYEKIEHMLENDLLEKIRALTPRGFELMVLDLCKKMNADTRFVHAGKPGDGGIDGIITLNDGFGLSKIYVQAKKHKHQVRNDDVRAFVGALSLKATKKGIFMTTATIPDSAKEEVEKNENVSVRLVDGHDLVCLMIKHGAGVSDAQTVEIKKMDDAYFDGFG